MVDSDIKLINKKKQVWIIAGRDQFAKYGMKGINVDILSRKLNISRTSFYHFFRTKDEFLQEMVDYWIKDGTVRVIESTKHIKDPKERMKKIYDLALHNLVNDMFMSQLRYAAARNKFLKNKMDEAEDLRIKTLTNLFNDLGLKDKESKERAYFVYFLFLGFLEYYKSEGYTEDKIQQFTNTVINTLFK